MASNTKVDGHKGNFRIAPWQRKLAKIRNIAQGYLFISPAIIGLLLFNAGAIIGAFALSFTEWSAFVPPQWIGLVNYKRLFSDPLFPKVIWNTIYYALLTVPVGTVLSLALALLVNRSLKGIVFFRSIYFLPVVTTGVAVALVWGWLYNPQFGPINFFLGKIGISGPKWLSSTSWAMPAIAAMTVWRGAGIYMMLFLAALQNIPEELYEASSIDGAGAWQKFWNVTLPLISPMTFFILIIRTISSLNSAFDQIHVTTQGGPRWSTLTLGYQIYLNAFQYFQLGFASSAAYVLFAIIIVMTLIQFNYRKWVHY